MPGTDGAGPFKTEDEAHAFALALGGPAREGWSILNPAQNHQMLLRACEVAGVSLGAYDKRILGWLANWEDDVCAVVVGLIVRAARKDTSDG